MLGYIYLILSIVLGYTIVSFVFPQLKDAAKSSFSGRPLGLSAVFVLIPAWFTVGIITISWISYILACAFSGREIPLLLADEIAMIIAVVVSGIGIFFSIRRDGRQLKGEIKKITVSEQILFIFLAILFAVLIFITFHVAHGQLYVGLTVFGDFTPHISMIRSFSYGQNFPTQYSVCAGEDVKYHFMFEFLVGNLEFLGMRIDHAFNIPSFLSVISMFALFYSFACRISGKRSVGIISCILLTFRSSLSFLTFAADIPYGMPFFKSIFDNTDFIGSTNNENWGMWNLNVYINQRHFALGLCVMLIIFHLFLPRLFEAFDVMKEYGGGFKSYLAGSLLNIDGWKAENILMPIGAGVLLGALGFFNGAVLIGTVMILFFIAAVSQKRVEFIITAAIAGILSLIQTAVFTDGGVISFSLRYGFLSDNRTLASSILYVFRLLGFLPLVILIYFAFTNRMRKYLIFIFTVPFIFAFHISLTPDIAVNHKYIMISVMMLDIFAASAIVALFEYKKLSVKALAVIMLFVLTITGVYETYLIYKRNNPVNSIVNNLDDPLTVWVSENCSAKDLFLTSNYFLSNSSAASSIILGGAMLYNAWEYYGWSAGYNTAGRDEIVNEIYSSHDINRIRYLLDQVGIDYIVIDYANRTSDYYELNEEIFAKNFKVAYTQGSKLNKATIYYAR